MKPECGEATMDVLESMYGPGATAFAAKVVMMPKPSGGGEQGVVIFGSMFPAQAGAETLAIHDYQRGTGKRFHHERWDGQLIFVPQSKRYTDKFNHMTASQVLCSGFHDDNKWKPPYWTQA